MSGHEAHSAPCSNELETETRPATLATVRQLESAWGVPHHELHYAASPVQRRSTTALQGITVRENAAVSHLSAGRVDLHALGASLQQVPASDARLQAVGARSLAQGTQALVSNTADRGHELWHLAQQALGRVPITGTVAGQPLNTQPQLEAEADRMGAAIASFHNSAALPQVRADDAVNAAIAGPIQRRVDSFEAETKDYTPPKTDLIDTIDYDYFAESEKTVRKRIADKLINAKVSDTEVPVFIEASISPRKSKDETPKRQSHKSSTVGKFGSNEFFLRAGGLWEVFEGGHLIPHEVWRTKDSDVKFADDYVNLVPMSRNLNVGTKNTWHDIENVIVNSYKKGNSFDLEISIDHTPYDLSYDWLAKLFNLNVDVSMDGTDTLKMYGWLPTSINAKDVTGKKAVKLGTAFENEIHNTFSPIDTGPKLVAALQGTPLWLRISTALRDELEDL